MIQLLRPAEAAQMLAVSPKTLQRLRARGKLPAHRIAGQVRYNRADIERLALAGLEVGTAAPSPPLPPGPVADFEQIRRKP